MYIPVIADFGISKDNKESNKINSEKIASRQYASPEQLDEENDFIDYNTDLWSFGIIALGLFLDTFPFSYKTLAEIREGILLPIDFLPEAWQRIIKKCLIADPAKRIQNCEECKKILSEYPELDFIFTPEINLTETEKEQEDDTEIIRDKNSVDISELNQSIKSIESKTNEIAGTATETKNIAGIIETYVKKAIGQNRKTHIFMIIFAVLLLCFGGCVVYYSVGTSSFKTTIQIMDWKGRPSDKINQSNCKIKILDKSKKSITDGSVEFNEIPIKYKNNKNHKVKVVFFPCEDCGAFELVCDSIVLQKDAELRIKIKGLDRIFGYVKDNEGNPIDSAKVEIIGVPPRYTDEMGYYEIFIPEEQQEWEQTITVTKQRFSVGNRTKDLEGNKNSIDFTLTQLK